MNSATISIPARWESAVFQIKQFIEAYAASHHLRFAVTLTSQFDAGQVYITDDSLTETERQACENAISAVSTRLNANLSKDPWQACIDVIAELETERQQIVELMDRQQSSTARPLGEQS